MSAYDDSKYVTARKQHACAVCRQLIAAGTRCLAFRPATNRTTHVCEADSVKTEENGHPKWWCKVVVERIRAGAVAAAPTVRR
jgi:hypothetical protein